MSQMGCAAGFVKQMQGLPSPGIRVGKGPPLPGKGEGDITTDVNFLHE